MRTPTRPPNALAEPESGAPGPRSRAPRKRPERRNRLRETEPAAYRPARKGRGARVNPAGRFERTHLEPDLDVDLRQDWDGQDFQGQEVDGQEVESRDLETQRDPSRTPGPERDAPGPPPRPTEAIPDPSRTILATNQSPDIPFETSLNPYRGCEHGCAYCYARPTHEYLGYSAGLDFETKILVKEKAPELLRRALSAPRWKPQVVALSGVTDAYQPLERKLELTRRCVEVFAAFRNPISIITKNALVTRDLDLLRELNESRAVSVHLSITTLDPALQRVLEPRASAPHERLRAVERLAEAGIPVGVNVAPIIPGLTDAEIPALLSAAASAGARRVGHIVLRLPHGLRELFDDWLQTHRPMRREKVLRRIEAVRGGQLNDARFGSRMRGEGLFAEQIRDLFALMARKHGLDQAYPELSTADFRRPGGTQLDLGL